MDELETGGRGKTQPLKEWQPLKIQHKLLRPTRSKMAKDSTSSKPWASLYAHYKILASTITHPPELWRFQGQSSMSEGGLWPNYWKYPSRFLPKIVGIILSLITQPIKTNHPISGGFCLLRMTHTLSVVLLILGCSHFLRQPHVLLSSFEVNYILFCGVYSK